jgi:integrase
LHKFEYGELLKLMVNPRIQKQIQLRQLDNDTLFERYLTEMKLRQLSSVYISDTRDLLCRFKDFLDGQQPLPELAMTFLAQYANHKQSTFLRYFNLIQGFMRWYGTPLDLKPKAPRFTPAYYSNGQIEKLREAATNKKTHKKLAVRDTLLIEVATKTGMRRTELANLKVRDLQNGRLQVKGKGGKVRTIPLLESTLSRLEKFCANKDPDNSIFGLKPSVCCQRI